MLNHLTTPERNMVKVTWPMFKFWGPIIQLDRHFKFGVHDRLLLNGMRSTSGSRDNVHTKFWEITVIPRLHDTSSCLTGCQTGCPTSCTTGWVFVYTIQPVVQPPVPVVSCIQTFNRLYNQLFNRFDNRLYRVNGVLISWKRNKIETMETNMKYRSMWPIE